MDCLELSQAPRADGCRSLYAIEDLLNVPRVQPTGGQNQPGR
jgi:hypothetical protein